MQCDSSINSDNITLVIFVAGIEVVFSLFCLFMVIYISIRLKKKAWDSPAKRFGHFFNVYFVELYARRRESLGTRLTDPLALYVRKWFAAYASDVYLAFI